MIKYIGAVPEQAAQGVVAQAYAQIKGEMGALMEPLTLHSAAPSVLAGMWGAIRESLLAGDVRRDLKEAIAATVSGTNQCPYCVDAHTIMLHATAAHDTASALSRHAEDTIRDPAARAIVAWAKATRSPEAAVLRSPPFGPLDAPETIGTAVAFHYLNRVVNVFLGETPLPLNLAWAKRPLTRMAGMMFSRAARRAMTPGAALHLLPEAALPADLAWAAPKPAVAGAFARFAAAVEAAGREALPEEVRTWAGAYLQDWHGEDPGLQRSWVEQAVVELPEQLRPAGRLTLLTALASYQVDEGVVHAFRAARPEPEHLLGAVAWASFAAARRVGTWLNASSVNLEALIQGAR